MPPKKKAKPGKDEPAKLSDKELLQRAETELASLQRLLEIKTHETIEARKAERCWRERAEAATRAVQQQKEDMEDIAADMTRQYKNMQEQMARRVAELEASHTELAARLELKDAEMGAVQAQAQEMQQSAGSLENTYKRRMERMQLEFAQMLKDTLDKCTQRLEHEHTANRAGQRPSATAG